MNIKREALAFVYNDKMFWYIDREEYSSLNFRIFEQILLGMGCSYFIGRSTDDSVKLDLMYAGPFIRASEINDGIRMASTDDIVALKMNVISRGGRKSER